MVLHQEIFSELKSFCMRFSFIQSKMKNSTGTAMSDYPWSFPSFDNCLRQVKAAGNSQFQKIA